MMDALTCSTPTSSTRAAPCDGTSDVACSPIGPLRRTSPLPADPRPVSAPLRSTSTTTEHLTSSWPTVIRMTSPGSTPRWRRPRNSSWAGDRGRFELASPEVSPYFSRPVVGRGVAAGDLDNDGRVDLVVVHRDGPAALLRNGTPGGHWLGLRLRGTRSGRSPVGTRVLCQAGGRSRVRWLTSGTSYLSSSDPRLWFGLGQARKAERLEVRWPSGTVQTWSDVAADRILDIREGDDQPRVRNTIAPGK